MFKKPVQISDRVSRVEGERIGLSRVYNDVFDGRDFFREREAVSSYIPNSNGEGKERERACCHSSLFLQASQIFKPLGGDWVSEEKKEARKREGGRSGLFAIHFFDRTKSFGVSNIQRANLAS